MGQASSSSHPSRTVQEDTEMATSPTHEKSNGRDNSGHLNEDMRTLIWEVNVARESLKNFGRIINAHAIVLSLLVTITYVGFLQPPRGLTADSHVFESTSVKLFIIFNSLSLYSAICGLLVYVSCSYATIMTLGTVAIPERLNNYGLSLLHKLRSALRHVALPGVRAHSKMLFTFLTISLGCGVVAFGSAGFAVVGRTKGGILSVLVPLVAGVIAIVYWMCLSAAKMWTELKFDDRLGFLWRSMGKAEVEVDVLGEDARQFLDPQLSMPAVFRALKECVRSDPLAHTRLPK